MDAKAFKPDISNRPNIYDFHDYREFLKIWLEYLKSSSADFSIRSLAKSAGLSHGYLSIVLTGQRNLAKKSLQKLLPHLHLERAEQSHLKNLVTLSDSPDPKERLKALKDIQKSKTYKLCNPKEFELFQYLTQWYYVAIREMVSIEGFKLDSKWIQKNLYDKVSKKEIELVIEFLKEHDFILVKEDGTVELPDKEINCTHGVFQVALRQFHEQMHDMAKSALENVPKELRKQTGYTFALDQNNVDEVKAIIEEAKEKIKKLERKQDKSDVVYHVNLSAFPLAGVKK